MEWLTKKFSSTFYQFVPIVRAEEDTEDPQVILRKMYEKKECHHLLEKLETCNARVRSKKKTAETCDEEMIDFVTCIDGYTAKILFTKLK